MIYIVNKSTRVSDAESRKMVKAWDRQVREHIAPAWNRKPIAVRFITDESKAAAGAWVIAILDDADQAGVLGWHTEGPDGKVYGRIFAGPTLDNGGTVLSGSNSVSVTGSHEVGETFCDASVSEWDDSGRGFLVAEEISDPVEADSYVLDGVSVSNFVTPAYFDPQAPAGSRFDYLGKLTKPFSMSKGGYWVQMANGRTTQKFSRSYPAWKKATKAHPTARSARRMATAAALPLLQPAEVAGLEAAAIHAVKVFSSAFLGIVLATPLVQANVPTLKAAALAGAGAVFGLVQKWANVPGPAQLARRVIHR